MKKLYALAVMLAAAGSAVAADLPKEGRYDFTACWAGVSNTIDFSKTHTAFSFDMTGAIRSNPPGGIFDKESFRCVGMNYALDGKAGGTAVCEAVDQEGNKRLTFFSNTDGKIVRESLKGTGKYEGLTTSGTVQPLGPFPVIKPGTFQSCNQQTGTYKLKLVLLTTGSAYLGAHPGWEIGGTKGTPWEAHGANPAARVPTERR